MQFHNNFKFLFIARCQLPYLVSAAIKYVMNPYPLSNQQPEGPRGLKHPVGIKLCHKLARKSYWILFSSPPAPSSKSCASNSY